MGHINVTKSQLPDRQLFHEYVDRILDSGWLTNHGACVQELEKRLEGYLGVPNVILVNNATLGLQVAYKALGLKGEVITSPFTFIATASSMVWEGLDVVFADIDPETFNVNVSEIEKNISARTSAIVPVHVFGNPCEVEAIDAIAKHHDIKVIYDAAHAFGVRLKGESVLLHGDVSVVSFHATKLFHTIEGGALIIKDDALCEQVRKMINFGITGQESIECLGINAKMNEFQAAMGLCLLGEMDEVILRRQLITEKYDEMLDGYVIKQAILNGTTRNYGYYPVLFESESITKSVQSHLNINGVFPRRYFYPTLNKLEFLSLYEKLELAEDVSSRILCLPIYDDLSVDECRYISQNILKAMGAGE